MFGLKKHPLYVQPALRSNSLCCVVPNKQSKLTIRNRVQETKGWSHDGQGTCPIDYRHAAIRRISSRGQDHNPFSYPKGKGPVSGKEEEE